jgi:hypothetical protein
MNGGRHVAEQCGGNIGQFLRLWRCGGKITGTGGSAPRIHGHSHPPTGQGSEMPSLGLRQFRGEIVYTRSLPSLIEDRVSQTFGQTAARIAAADYLFFRTSETNVPRSEGSTIR